MSTLTRGFNVFGDRYEHDARLTCANGWAQVDTWQDASYFGVWTNPTTFEIFTYCEGDKTLETCDGPDDYRGRLTACLEFYDCPDRPTKIDAAFNPEMAAVFAALGFADRVH